MADKKPPSGTKKELFHFNKKGEKVWGVHEDVSGNVSDVSGNFDDIPMKERLKPGFKLEDYLTYE